MKYLIMFSLLLSFAAFSQDDSMDSQEPQTEDVVQDVDGGDEGSQPDTYDQEPQEEI